MNILLVTENMQDAGFIERELPKRILGVHIDTVGNIQDAIGRLTSPGGFSAMLLDAMLHEGDPISLIRTVRAGKGPIAVIGLVENADFDSETRLVVSEADNFVIKDAGFLDGLATLLRRAGANASTLYAVGGVGSSTVLVRNSLTPDTAGATRVLVRNDGSVAARNYATRVTAAPRLPRPLPSGSIEVRADRGALNSRLHELEQELQGSEQRGSRLQEALAEALRAGQDRERETAERHAERERDLQQQLQTAETERGRLLEGLRQIQTQLSIKTEGLVRELAALEEKHRQAEEGSRSEIHELEHRNRAAAAENASLRDSLQAAKDWIADQIKQHLKDMGQWESARLAMERQNRELQEKVARLEEANTRLAFEHRELLVHLEASQRELQTSAGELVDELSRIIEKHNHLLGKA